MTKVARGGGGGGHRKFVTGTTKMKNWKTTDIAYSEDRCDFPNDFKESLQELHNKHYLLMELTLGTVSLPQMLSDSNLSRISQAKMVGLSRL